MAKNCLVFITVYIGQNEGLPNITGEVQFGTEYLIGCEKAIGAFVKGSKNHTQMGITQYEYQSASVKFDAAKGETKTDNTLKTATEHKVYGASNHVTPCNATIKVWQRIS